MMSSIVMGPECPRGRLMEGVATVKPASQRFGSGVSERLVSTQQVVSGRGLLGRVTGMEARDASAGMGMV
jgi:hypothetical protein